MINIIGYMLILFAAYDIVRTIQICFDIKRIVGFELKDLFTSQIQRIIIQFIGDVLVVIFVIAKLGG